MHNANTPPASELPSSRTLVKWTAIAAGVTLLLLVTIVLPAEYGVDPTGVGRVTGLQRMGEIKMALAKEAAEAEANEATARALAGTATAPAAPTPAVPAPDAASAPAATAATTPPSRSDTVSVTLQPGQGAEYKLGMREGARASFAWSVAGGVVNYDLHADRPGVRYHGYEKGQGKASAEGTLVAAFDGMHGWFWRNRGSAPVTVTLRTTGDYSEIRRIE